MRIFDIIHRYETKMEFTTIGKDLSLDFVKAICIILVLMNHSISESFSQDAWFWLWGYPAVPLFLLIQVFHSYKKGFDGIHLRLGKIWSRAVFPFLVVQILLFTVAFSKDPTVFLIDRLYITVFWGGRGPGSYYPWIFIQFAILLPLLRPLFRSLNDKWLLVLFLGLSIGSEMLCSYLHVPAWVYRLLFFRYIFLIFLGYRLVVRGIVLNVLTVSLSIISIVAVYLFEVKGVDWTPFFFDSREWPTCHWICYFYVAYPMLYFLCRFFYWLPPGSMIENFVCKMGQHSYAIYIFQLFYFFIVDNLLLQGTSTTEFTVVGSFLYFAISLIVCVLPVLHVVSNSSNWVVMGKVSVALLVVASVVTFVGWKWRPFYVPPTPFAPYEVKHHQDDSLRVIMIGDSWVYFHETLRRDSTFENELKRVLQSRRVKVTAKGKAGATSGEIYQRMSAERTWEMDYDLNYCAQPVIEAGADYCVISAGINDARQRRGKVYYVGSYLRILRLLLSYGIRPVVMEIPDVDIDEAFDGNTLYYRLKARICMGILKTELYGVEDYRRTLKDSLVSTHLMDSVVYVSAASWNPEGWRDKRNIYTDDHFHLNLPGYALLDSCFSKMIVDDWKKRSLHPSLGVN